MKKVSLPRLVSVLLLLQALSLYRAEAAPATPPNIVVILVDDMGFSDIGCYGSEIPTPNIDALAAGGVRFTQFYNTARCSTTRASLLTGLYPHQAGMGYLDGLRLPESKGTHGRLNDRCVTMAEVLGMAGYHTSIVGKWHLGQQNGTPPWERGFQRTANTQFGELYFPHERSREACKFVYLDGRKVPAESPEVGQGEWYSTFLFTDWALKFVDDARAKQKPFFLYFAHGAPHFPLKAPQEVIAKYRGKYLEGWDKLREARHRRQIELGIVDPRWPLSPRPAELPAWDSLSPEDRDLFDNVMAVYAAMIDCIDQSVGQLVAGLKERGVYENTLVLFLSDNGGNGEFGPRGIIEGERPLGGPESHVFLGTPWAMLNNTPFRRYKHFIHEGGISTPLIAHWPGGIPAERKGKLEKQPGHLIDIMATAVGVSGAHYPAEFKGHSILPMEGISLLPAFRGQPLQRPKPIFWEHEGNRGIRSGDWKLVSRYLGDWELYNIADDRTEQHDLSATKPEVVREMARQWDGWAAASFVDAWTGGPRTEWGQELAPVKKKKKAPGSSQGPALPDAPGRWTKERANAWYAGQPFCAGANFSPSSAGNQLEMWRAETFDAATIDRELGYARELGFNAMRVFLHDLFWLHDREGLLERMDRYLAIADRHGIKTVFVFFDSCWNPYPQWGPQPDPRPRTHNALWVQSPGIEVLLDPAKQAHLKPYVQGVLERFAGDRRILAWDLWNEPENFDGGVRTTPPEPRNKPELVAPLLEKVFVWAREVGPSQPLTSAVWNDPGNLADLNAVKRVQFSNSDVISYHFYAKEEPTMQVIHSLQRLGRPMFCTEYMARIGGGQFDPLLGLMRDHKIAAFCWDLVDGRTQTIYPVESWRRKFTAEPKVWNTCILRADGTPYSPAEADYIRKTMSR